MTTTCVRPTASILWDLAYGVSPEAKSIKTALREVSRDFEESLTLGWTKKEMRNELVDVFNECAQPNWDGYGAEPVRFDTYSQANTFLGALPTTARCPTISAAPDGDIVFEWRSGNKRAASVSISRFGTLTYAAILGTERQNGVANFDGQIPDVVLQILQRIW
jgi:hypothetical protein